MYGQHIGLIQDAVLDPRQKDGYFKESWGPDLADKALARAEEIVSKAIISLLGVVNLTCCLVCGAMEVNVCKCWAVCGSIRRHSSEAKEPTTLSLPLEQQ